VRRSPSRCYTERGARLIRVAVTLVLTAVAPYSLLSQSRSAIAASNEGALPLDRPRALSQPRPTADEIREWSDRKFGMFIHFGLYSTLGGIWQGKQIDNGYSEQIMANGPIPLDQYSALASQFNPTHFDPDAIVALAKAAGMKFIVITSKHHDGFNMFHTAQSSYNIVDVTPYKRDVVKQLADACARGEMKFGVYYSSIDWHQPGASTYIPGNSNPILPAHEAFNVAQLKELLSNYGPISEIWFDMGKPTAEQSKHFTETVHRLQPRTMVSGRVFNYEGDFTVMGDNEVPKFQIDEPWQTPASIFPETWGYRSWQKRDDLQGKIRENILRLVEVVSRGGNYILNIGPEGDGSVVPYEADVLRGIGDWLKDRGEAIYATTAQPFRKLDFGYATVGQGKLYLFVKDVPGDGVLRLPGLRAGQLNSAYLLGSASHESFAVTSIKDGVSVRIEQDALATVGYLPVIVLPFSGRLEVAQASTAPDAAGNFLLTPSVADHFFNYNGAGYEAPETLYKLRWFLIAPPGRYRAEIDVKPTHAKAGLDFVVDGHRIPLTVPPSAATTVTIKQNIRILPTSFEDASRVSIELTPPEPFLKGTQLPRTVLAVRLVRER
jgi:alpha-L-fucosidase